MKNSIAVFLLSLMAISLVSVSCGNKKKASCEAYRADIQVTVQEGDLASN
jgi:hypothetical protein